MYFLFSGSKIDAHKSVDVQTNDEKENDVNEALLKLQSKFQPRQAKGKKTDNK